MDLEQKFDPHSIKRILSVDMNSVHLVTIETKSKPTRLHLVC